MRTTTDELKNLTNILTFYADMKENCIKRQEYEKAVKYRTMIKNTIKLINHVSGTSDEVLTDEQKKEKNTEKVISALKKESRNAYTIAFK